MKLRTGRADDVDALLVLEGEAFGAEAWSEASVRSELAGVPDTRYVVIAEEGGVPVGYGVLMVVAETADVPRVAVTPSHRRLGVGRKLLTAMLTEAARRGCATLLLELASDNAAAQALYAAAGFRVIDRRRGYYGPGRDALVMSRPLSAGAGSTGPR